MKKKITHIVLTAALLMTGLATVATPAYAADNWEVGSGNESKEGNAGGNTCGGAKTSIIKCNEKAGESAIIYLLRYVVQLMTYGVGILAVGGVVIAGVMYASASGSQEQVKKAKMMLFNVALGLVAYAFMFAITNFLIPGGVFN